MANAKVEVAVQLAQRWIHARLRNRRFFSLSELNAAIRELLERFNNRRTRHLGASRRELFESVERQALRATHNLLNFLRGNDDYIQANAD